jgi:predicted Zn-ribbon and HTH transcriptional regulator
MGILQNTLLSPSAARKCIVHCGMNFHATACWPSQCPRFAPEAVIQDDYFLLAAFACA